MAGAGPLLRGSRQTQNSAGVWWVGGGCWECLTRTCMHQCLSGLRHWEPLRVSLAGPHCTWSHHAPDMWCCCPSRSPVPCSHLPLLQPPTARPTAHGSSGTACASGCAAAVQCLQYATAFAGHLCRAMIIIRALIVFVIAHCSEQVAHVGDAGAILVHHIPMSRQDTSVQQ